MDIILYNILAGLSTIIIGYFFGSIPMGKIICKLFIKKDPTKEGSNNPGATNIGRLYGKKWGYLTLFFDFIKCVSPIWICWAIMTFVRFGDNTLIPLGINIINKTDSYADHIIRYPAYWLTYIGAILGHCHSIFSKFKGGKGSSTILAMTITTTWLYSLLPVIVFIILVRKTRIMSMSVLIAAFIAIIQIWIFYILISTSVIGNWFMYFPGYGITLEFSLTAALTFTVCVLYVFIRHRANIRRLKEHTENKTNLF